MCYSALVGACRKVGSYVGQNNFEFYIPWQIITQRIVLDWCGVYVGNVLHAERDISSYITHIQYLVAFYDSSWNI